MKRLITLFCVSLFACSACYANAVLPLGMFLYPSTVLYFIPITLIEAAAFKQDMENITWRQSLKAVTLSNLVSTLVGFLVLTPALMIIELYVRYFAVTHNEKGIAGVVNKIFLTLHTAALNGEPFKNAFLNVLAVITGTSLAMVPFYFLSVWIEGKVNKRILVPQGFNGAKVQKVTWLANLYSYSFLISAMGILSLSKDPLHFWDKILNML